MNANAIQATEKKAGLEPSGDTGRVELPPTGEEPPATPPQRMDGVVERRLRRRLLTEPGTPTKARGLPAR